ncbi:stage IV sporulation protein A [Aneurinibacillus soli]|uniref:Stage IV sporulation protein A n=1 Tax=Aneurinibacillus soli TaxID=1500254 RepID=A0A0U5C5H1_9BACL|nr:stage IV sporulation protein A [Aneurinibacillus soli]PYE62545.1 stage IV sporulation protein A [Aneurinibacillus soli]BAU27107.1 Stage IV sporulation protein A [Aneurinibacillus soli]
MDQVESKEILVEELNNSICIDIVGPARTGKSTFIKSFVDLYVLSNISDEQEKDNIISYLPEIGKGKIMQTIQKTSLVFQSVTINGFSTDVKITEQIKHKIHGAKYPEVKSEEEISNLILQSEASLTPYPHSHITLLFTTDGSFGGFPRYAYIDAEKKSIEDLNIVNKPFVIVVNTANPESEDALLLQQKLQEEHSVPVFILSAANLNIGEFNQVLKNNLCKHPINELNLEISPSLIMSLDESHSLRMQINDMVKEVTQDIACFCHLEYLLKRFMDFRIVSNVQISKLNMSAGTVEIWIDIDEEEVGKVEDEIFTEKKKGLGIMRLLFGK